MTYDQMITEEITQLEAQRKKIEENRKVSDYVLDPKWQKIDDKLSVLRNTQELRNLPRDTTLYFVCDSFRSDSSGNHAKYTVYYITEEKTLAKVWLINIMKKYRDGYFYDAHGGNYSFIQSIANHIATTIGFDAAYFQYEEL